MSPHRPLNPWHPLSLVLCVLALALAVTLSACGGGVGTGGTGSFASGPITGFGSVVVNAVRFDDSQASVEDGDGARRTREDLRLGMTVEIDSSAVSTSASGSTATASRIRYDSELRGPVGSVDAAAGSFMLLGQRVVLDARTVFDLQIAGGAAGLGAGRWVEVYAVFDAAAARYRATRVDTALPAAGARLRGPLAAVDSGARTLRIGATNYGYATASNAPASLVVGQYVRLRLALADAQWAVSSFGTALPALPDADGVSIKGLISAFTSAASFSVNGRPVSASGARFPDGSSGMGLGVRVEAKGRLRDGTLLATEVSIESDDEEEVRGFELSGSITSVDAAQRTLVLRGQTVSTARPDLRFEHGTVADLVAGRRIELKGQLSADRLRIEATLIKFE
jgi:hypothetical protein